MGRISIKGVLIGGIVDIVATNIFGMLVFMAFALGEWSRLSGTDTHTAAGAVLASPGFGPAAFCAGVLASVLGGYVAARIAKHDELINGALSAYLCVAFGLIGMVTATHGNRVLELLTLPLSPFLGLVGGYLQLALRRRATRQLV